MEPRRSRIPNMVRVADVNLGSADGSGDLSQRLETFVSGARVDDAARSRARRRWLCQQLAESQTVVGLLLAARERDQAIVVRTTVGTAHRGAVLEVGSDVFVLGSEDGSTTLVRLDAIATVEAAPGHADGASRLSFAEALRLLPERVRIRVITHAGRPSFDGELASLGTDLVTLLTKDGGPLHLPIAGMAIVWVEPVPQP